MLSQQLTIVIPTYNESKYIARTLYAIAAQSGTHKVKIIIADASSTDGTRAIAEANGFELGLNLQIIDGGLPAVGRNAGAKLATTPYVLFLDADVTFTHRQAISQAVDELAFGGFDMVSTTPVYKGELDTRASIMFNLNKHTTWFLSKTEPFAIGGFTMVSRQSFKSLGGYDERATQSEDWLLSRKISPNKFKLIPDLITQDNRRFKRYGYWSMVKLLYNNWKNRNNIEYFYQDKGYWK
jgi:glycosyltransferase involved in cell wall biosynthesis